MMWMKCGLLYWQEPFYINLKLILSQQKRKKKKKESGSVDKLVFIAQSTMTVIYQAEHILSGHNLYTF